MLDDKLKKDAVRGTEEFHAFMRSIAVSSLRSKAGFIPPKMNEPPPPKNDVHWQSPKSDISAGVWWVFYACEQGMYTQTELRQIWRYGQIQKHKKQWKRKLLSWGIDRKLIKWFMNWLTHIKVIYSEEQKPQHPSWSFHRPMIVCEDYEEKCGIFESDDSHYFIEHLLVDVIHASWHYIYCPEKEDLKYIEGRFKRYGQARRS